MDIATTFNSNPIVFDITTAAIEELRQKYSVYREIKDRKQLKEAKAASSKIKKYRIAVEKRRKELKSPALEFGRKVDAKAKELTRKLLEIEDPLKASIEEFEERERAEKEAAEKAERERIEKLDAQFQVFENPLNPLSTQEEIIAFIEKVSSVEMTEEVWQERLQEANMKRSLVLQQAKTQLEQRKQFDEAQAILQSQKEKLVTQQKQDLSESSSSQKENIFPFHEVVKQKISDESIVYEAINNALLILKGANRQIQRKDLKEKLEIFIDMLGKVQDSVSISA